MFITNKFFAILTLFFSFYVSGIAINLKQSFQQNLGLKHVDFIQEKKTGETQFPAQFIDPVDEREIDEEEQSKIAPYQFAQAFILTCVFKDLTIQKEETLPQTFKQNFSVQQPRVILYHSWKYFIV